MPLKLLATSQESGVTPQLFMTSYNEENVDKIISGKKKGIYPAEEFGLKT